MKNVMPVTRPLSRTAGMVVLAKSGEDRALAALLKHIEKRLLRFSLFLTGDLQTAKDLSQEVYLKVIENLDGLEDSTKFSSWLFQMARNRFLDYVRSPQNAPKSDYLQLENVLRASGLSIDVSAQLWQGLGKLSSEERAILLLTCMEGYTYAEVAKWMKVTEESIRCKLFRIKKLFKKAFVTVRTDTQPSG